jgi:hypothetical protein
MASTASPVVCTENSDSHVVVMQSAEERMGANASDPLNWARDRRILSNDRCVLDAL